MKKHSCVLHWQKHQHWAFTSASAFEGVMVLLLDRLCSTCSRQGRCGSACFGLEKLVLKCYLFIGEDGKSASNTNSSLVVE
jgi:hypothetical protein